jgi:acetyltransferase-like isoleucine patch superfamily enzyme
VADGSGAVRPPQPVAGGAFVSPDAEIALDVELSPGAVVLGATVIGPGCLVEAGAVLGKRPRLRPGSSAASAASAASATSDAGSAGSAGSTGELIVGEGVTICAGAVVYAGAQLGARVIVGDQAQVRERVRLGERTVVGRGSTVDFDTVVGARVSIQTLVYLTARGLVEDDVFIGPGVTTTNDDTMGRHPRGEPLRGPILRRACRLGGGCVLTPGVEIGEEAFVAAGAVVTRDVPARAVVMGVPARVVREVGDADLIQRWR